MTLCHVAANMSVLIVASRPLHHSGVASGIFNWPPDCPTSCPWLPHRPTKCPSRPSRSALYETPGPPQVTIDPGITAGSGERLDGARRGMADAVIYPRMVARLRKVRRLRRHDPAKEEVEAPGGATGRCETR